jgi:protocatechuate 3,4-dioxygenase beta subunit
MKRFTIRPAPTRPVSPTDTAATDRRAFLGIAAKGALSVVVSQTLLSCGAGSATAAIDATSATGATPGSASTSCVLTASLTEGPYFVDEKLHRSDIRSDPTTGIVSAGVPLTLKFAVARISNGACTPLTGAYLDIWHCDAAGNYSDETANGTSGRKHMRGYQITDADGVVNFTSIYPGWYSGRAVHVHFKLRIYAGSAKSYEFTSQFFLDEAQTSAVHANSPYNTRGQRNVVNTTDGIFNSLTTSEKSALTLQAAPTANGYAGVINLTVQVS